MYVITEPASVPSECEFEPSKKHVKLIVSNDIPAVLARGSKCIGAATTYELHGPCQNRYREVAIWKTPAGRIVAHRGRISRWQGEVSVLTVFEGDALEDVAPSDWTPEEQEAFEQAHKALGLTFGRLIE